MNISNESYRIEEGRLIGRADGEHVGSPAINLQAGFFAAVKVLQVDVIAGLVEVRRIIFRLILSSLNMRCNEKVIRMDERERDRETERQREASEHDAVPSVMRKHGSNRRQDTIIDRDINYRSLCASRLFIDTLR